MACCVCHAAEVGASHDAREMMYGLRDLHRYDQCAACGSLQLRRIPECLHTYYGPAYYSFQSGAGAGLKAWLLAHRDRHAALGQGRLGRVLAHFKPTRQYDFLQPIRHRLSAASRFLDVGCGSGGLLRKLRSGGFRHATGVDAFVPAHVDADGERLVTRGELSAIGGHFDVVMFHHSLEHMADPAAALRLAWQRLVPGGHCIVRVPLMASFVWRKYGVNWVQLDAPRHLFLPTPQGMQTLAQRAGFECIELRYDSTAFQFWGSEQYVQDVPLRDPRSYAVDPHTPLFDAARLAAFEAEAARLNAAQQGDQAAFYLRKRAPS